MRHARSRYQLNRFTSWRKATLKSMARNVLLCQRIITTKTKAKAAQPLVEKLIGLGKENSLAARRAAFKILCDHRLVKLLFTDIAPRFDTRTSGFTRILALGLRRGDSAQLALLELTEQKKKEKKQKKKKEAKAELREAPGEEKLKAQAPAPEAKQPEEHKTKTGVAVKERPPIEQKPSKKFLGGIRNIFKKKSDFL